MAFDDQKTDDKQQKKLLSNVFTLKWALIKMLRECSMSIEARKIGLNALDNTEFFDDLLGG